MCERCPLTTNCSWDYLLFFCETRVILTETVTAAVWGSVTVIDLFRIAVTFQSDSSFHSLNCHLRASRMLPVGCAGSTLSSSIKAQRRVLGNFNQCLPLCCSQAVFWGEDWPVLCVVGLVYRHVNPCSPRWCFCLPVWTLYYGLKSSEVSSHAKLIILSTIQTYLVVIIG